MRTVSPGERHSFPPTWRGTYLSLVSEYRRHSSGVSGTMIAHTHGQLWNASSIAGSLGVSAPTVRHYLDILEDTYIVRQLPPYFVNMESD